MLHLHRKHRHLSKSSKLIFARTLIAIGIAAIDTIWAIYMESFGLSESAIGFLSAGLVLISLLTALYSTRFLEKYNKIKLLIISLTISGVAYLLIATYKNIYLFLLFAIVLTIASIFRTNTFGIIFRDNTKDSELNEKEGILYSFENLGWIAGPLLAGFTIAKFGISSVFFLSAIFFFIGTTAFLISNIKRIKKKRDKIDSNPLKNLRDFIKNKKLRMPYFMVSGLSTWWALIYIYVPIFAIKKGITPSQISIYMTALIVPLFLLEYYVGKKSQIKGEKIFFTIGYTGLAITAISLFFIQNIIVQLSVIAIASIFAACLEPTQETFFFKRVTKKEEEKYYPIFQTGSSIGSLITKILIASTLLILSNQYAYITAGIILAIFAILSTKIKK